MGFGRKEKGDYFRITSVHREDIEKCFEEAGKPELAKRAKKLTDSEMDYIADKLADDYCNQLFWGSLEIIAERVIKGD